MTEDPAFKIGFHKGVPMVDLLITPEECLDELEFIMLGCDRVHAQEQVQFIENWQKEQLAKQEAALQQKPLHKKRKKNSYNRRGK